MDFDAIVIGSGFGGAVTACRLAENGYRVLVLERGRRWDKSSYPRLPRDPWLWNQNQPEQEKGWLDFRPFLHMAVAAGAAVGGTSLISANIMSQPPLEAFASGWPEEITFHELKPYSDAVARFMNVQRVPLDHWAGRIWADSVARRPGSRVGTAPHPQPLELAISFDRRLSSQLPGDRYPAPRQFESQRFRTAQGVEQGTCVHLGNCETGCDADAKNTLDRNYIPWAERHGADVRPLHLVTYLAPIDGGYRVEFVRLHRGKRIPGSHTARIVVVAAGSLGSTELLLRSRDVYCSLPRLSLALGRNWNPNGHFFPPSFFDQENSQSSVEPTGTEVDFAFPRCRDSDYWRPEILPLRRAMLETRSAPDPTERNDAARLFLDSFRRLMRGDTVTRNILPWSDPQGNPGKGTLSLAPSTVTGEPELTLDWDPRDSRPAVAAVQRTQERFNQAVGRRLHRSIQAASLHSLLTPQPLGGCNMAQTPDQGVVNHAGEVFGYRNLYVTDAAIVPVPLGVSPARTIGALAERCAALLCAEAR